MHKYKIFKKAIIVTYILLFSANSYSMQSQIKAKRAFDENLFHQKLNLLPKAIQRHAIGGFFWQRSPKIRNPNGTESDPQTIAIDYRLLPAILSLNGIGSIKHILWSINLSRRLTFFEQGKDLQIYQLKGFDKITSRFAVDFFAETQYIRYHPNRYVIFGYADKIEACIHSSHVRQLEQLNLEQLNLIFDLFKTQVRVNKATIKDDASSAIFLNGPQKRLFNSLPQSIQKNLENNYRLVMPTERQAPPNRPPPVRQTGSSSLYVNYKHKPLVRLVKIVMIAGLIYYGLHRAIGWQKVADRKIILLIAKALKHKKKFILATAAFIGAIEAYGPTASRYIARRTGGCAFEI